MHTQFSRVYTLCAVGELAPSHLALGTFSNDFFPQYLMIFDLNLGYTTCQVYLAMYLSDCFR